MKNFTPDTTLSGRRESIVESISPTASDNRQSTNTSYPGPVVFVPPNPTTATSISVDDEDTASIGSVPRNPSDAWQCLTGIAKRGDDGPTPETNTDSLRTTHSAFSFGALQNGTVADFQPNSGIKAYRLVQSRSLDPGTVWQLVARYAENFHPYLPLVPRKYFNRSALDSFATNEKHLLTAVLTIASKDLVERPDIHEYCSKYMHELISGIAAGADCDVEAVEALLLLAEWEPQGLRPRIERVGRGEEDRAAWMHVGLALRSGYFLGLDRTSFRGDPSGDTETEARRRLAWTSCYISDRLISVRIGRAFWSRGPGPMTGLVSQDFPSLQPIKDGDEDYARIFQATLDLTQLYGNVHDVLYSVAGSTPIQATLQLSYEYLRLYTNAFAFQAAISQSMVSKLKNDQSQREHLRSTFNDVASMQDARFIYESVDAAKAYLTILVDLVHPEKHLHFMPLRPKAATIASPAGTHQSSDFQVQSSTIPHRLPEQSNYMQFSPANDFSWLDLEAVGDYVSGDQLPGANTLAFDSFQNPDPYQTGQDRSQAWQPNWPGDMTNLLF
ncbi:unnamed protein product [Aspergillus oryzae]|uniref:Unnamed protein product n=2 Tax=Aspergillus oryzae TaxID=5062 RepID=A0AAN5C537_ASPOZ|nr:unnamed protein product [Aspergillus oryzae]GMF89757.1 unnamed protein product [Aspergillus oryzae]GMG16541.1 unnamed protein product [Aspergillus oryzae]GMG38043.1 unnamed protein product [Aspergillus oryzae]GMG51401.1 unnamed protein product [Aspergillus oryzae var. brunneus]